MWQGRSRRGSGVGFADRAEAGVALGHRLCELGLADPLVLGLARGGVVVAAAAASVLGAPLDVLVVRKIGHPLQPELGLGALAEGGDPVFNAGALAAARLTPADLLEVVAEERAECQRRVAAYRRGRPAPELSGRAVVVVDDGVATGATARAGLLSLRARGVARLVLATPVASPTAIADLKPLADDVVTLLVPEDLRAVSRWYGAFDQTTDEEVVSLIAT